MMMEPDYCSFNKERIMPNKEAKSRKRKRILENQRLNREGRTASQIARKKQKRARRGMEERKPWERKY